MFHQITPFGLVLYDLVIASQHDELILLILVEDMENRAVAVDARNRLGTVPVVHDVLRYSDPLENRGRYYIWWAR